MITRIENALVKRLSLGLGKMATVANYAGELDDPNLGVRRLPLVLVTYGGSRFEPVSSHSRGIRFTTQDTFVVMVMTRSLRSSVAGVQGGATDREIGVNQLLTAVKYLLINQTLDGLVKPIKPLQVQTLWNNAEVRREKLSAYALELAVRYDEPRALDDGKFPVGSTDKADVEWLFQHYNGELSPDDPNLHLVQGEIKNMTNGAKVALSISLHQGEKK